MEISDADAVRNVLADPAFVVPPVPHVESPLGIGWLRSHVGRRHVPVETLSLAAALGVPAGCT